MLKGLASYISDSEDDESEGEKKKKKKHKKKKKEVPKLPSAEEALSTAAKPKFLEEHEAKQELEAKQEAKQEEGLSRALSTQAIEDLEKQAQARAIAKEKKERAAAEAAAQAPNKRRHHTSSTGGEGGVDVFAGLHPWTESDARQRKRQLDIKEQQRSKVSKGQSFDGRTWKSEAEMVLRQQYD